MPIATVQKTTGAMIILMTRMKASPKGRIASPVSGHMRPDDHPGNGRDEHLHVEELEQAEGSHGRFPDLSVSAEPPISVIIGGVRQL